MGEGKRPITELLATNVMMESQQCFVNFYVLGCQFTGYIGPFEFGYYDPDIAVKSAVKAGCRCFVIDIDYFDNDARKDNFIPHIVVRDKQNKLMFNPESMSKNALKQNNIGELARLINHYAFEVAQNKTDPVILVLNFLRVPPGSTKSKATLDYFARVAKGLGALKDRMLQNEIHGGTYYRQKQEGKLLINNITDYTGKCLIFSNADTSGFTENKTYAIDEDLDYMVNLRLSYNHTKMGATQKAGDKGQYGILQSINDYQFIPKDRQEDVIDNTKLQWTVCLSDDPSKPVSIAEYKKAAFTFGVHCIPIRIFEDDNDFMFNEKLFKTYSYLPKPVSLRYIKPPIVIPGEPNPNTNANQGKLRSPTVGAN